MSRAFGFIDAMNKKKKIREDFRNSVFKRDGNKCRHCTSTDGELDVHHITDRNKIVAGGYVENNGISLCGDCHKKAELFHSTEEKEWEEGFHPDDLYKMIGSSKEKAIEAAENSITEKKDSKLWITENTE